VRKADSGDFAELVADDFIVVLESKNESPRASSERCNSLPAFASSWRSSSVAARRTTVTSIPRSDRCTAAVRVWAGRALIQGASSYLGAYLGAPQPIPCL
jgi:hypothetical protein